MSSAPPSILSAPTPAIKKEIFVSGPGTGKTSACIELFKNQILKSKSGIDSRSFFVLPSREHADRIQHLVLKKDLKGLFNAHILTINDLAAWLLGISAAESPTDNIRKRIIRELLSQTPLPYFEAVRHFEGFVDLLMDAIKEFHSSLLTIPEWEKRSQRLLKDGVFRLKFKDFSILLKKYHARLEEMGFKEPEEQTVELLRLKTYHKPLELVIFDSFYHFTRAQLALIQWIAGHSDHTVVTLTLSGRAGLRPSLFEFPEQTKLELIKMGFVETSRCFSENHRTRDAALRHLEANIFSDQPKVFSGKAESIQLFEAPNARAEIEMIAREIRRRYARTGVHYSDISLIMRRVGDYEGLIYSIFKERGIPVYIHERCKLAQHRFVVVLCHFFRLIREDWPREDLLFILKSNWVEASVPLEEVLWLERMASRLNIQERRERWLSILEKPGTPNRLKETLGRFVDWEKNFLNCAQFGKFESLFESFLDDLGMVVSDEADRQALKAIRTIFKSAGRFYRISAKRQFVAGTFVDDLRQSLESALFSVRPVGRNRVQVYDAVMALPKEYAVVFLTGLVEKVFPQDITEDALLKDRERFQLNDGEAVLEERLKRIAGERYFFYMALTRAKDQLFFSYPLYDSEGRATLPSFFVDEASRSFEALPPCRPGLAEFFPTAVKSENLDKTQAVLRDPKILKIFHDFDGPFSATRLETFAVCPFRYFASKVLRLQEPLEGREAIEEGILLHKVLEMAYPELVAGWKASGKTWGDLPAAKRVLADKLQNFFLQSPFQNEALYRQRVYFNQMRRILDWFAEKEKELWQRRGLLPSFFEWPFAVNLGGIPIEGKIDRVDVLDGQQKALVVDYKLSKRSQTIRRRLAVDLELQLPFYLLAVQKLLKLEVLGAELRFLKNDEAEGFYRESERDFLGVSPQRTFPDPEFDELLSKAERLAKEYVARLRKADISVHSKNCDHCSFSSVCRFEPWRLVYSQ